MTTPHRHAPDARLELLAPARTADIGIEAINHGADAVYIGAPAFGARTGAGNPLADIERLVRHAHRFGARIFATLNTILRDDELEEARRLAWALYETGADALIVQDMGLLELDLPPIQLHASTQTDIRTPEKARFLQDAGFSQMVLARELTLAQVRAIRAATDPARCTLEFFIHGALCVAYSGQCYISHAHTGRSANRGDCSQACRLPYNVLDQGGRIVVHQQHVLSLKDNDQSANLAALVDAGVRSFKIEGRYKDMGYVKNITAHYRQLLDGILAGRPELARASSGRCSYTFTPDPRRNYNRGATDYFLHGRQADIGAFDAPTWAGLPVGHVVRVLTDGLELEGDAALANGDGLTWFDLQRNLQGLRANRVERLVQPAAEPQLARWRVWPADGMAGRKDLRPGTEVSRNTDMAWDRLLEKKSADRRIALAMTLRETADGLALDVEDEDGHRATATLAHAFEPARDTARAETTLREQLGKLGNTIFAVERIAIALPRPWFLPAGAVNALRRDAIEKLEAARAAAWQRLPRAMAVEPPAPYPDGSLTYLANVFNHKARDFYARHGVQVIAAAYESHEETGEASLMITKHCVRYSLSLCPKQTAGVTGVAGTIRAEPLVLVNGSERLTLRFDCKPCEMHVVGRIKKSVLREAQAAPLQFYRPRPPAA
ncbi:peptidase U32 family protein [Pseudothauera rhizosphaerae]|uniref:U32 family peptidase n=1 Tax=Pseudothauera rhizosphaerae TaxID=2565932 RepID=A0A4S4AFW0_9RHOO|nr:U32 family peptidase [Pseudothauera rhizosphaerae]THF58093.1 U32 family peptidase [Pseudothauera rhizosphaerae]